ncbi:MAG: radical SAM protein, partial [Chitinophagales bacterium]|nr:B12-binding domain-containing radical SAM protein [Chitinophagales bacterium]MDW8274302.1 radical SAM protein [Chitinophagales bacterium]
MKVCLINPSRIMKLVSASMRPSPPLGLAYIAGALKADGHDVQIVDAIAEAPEQYVAFKGRKDIVIHGLLSHQIIQLIHPDTELIGITMMFSINWLHQRELIDEIGNAFPNVPIIAGGEHTTAVPEFCIRQTRRLTACVLGEGEETVRELARALENKTPLESVPGIVFRNQYSQPQRTSPRKRTRELTQIPKPYWDVFPLQKYTSHGISFGVELQNSFALPVLATRGCPYECTFCSSPQMWGTKYSMRPVSDVADEIESYVKKYGTRNFDFYDLTAVINKRWIIDFAKEIVNRRLDIVWQIPAGTRSEAIDREVAHWLYRSGCRNITYAPESGSPEILQIIKKKVSIDRMLQSIRHSSEEKMNIKINFMIGFPDEGHRHIWQSIWFLIRASWAGVNDMAPAVFAPYPGSALFQRLVDEGKINIENDEYFMKIIQ